MNINEPTAQRPGTKTRAFRELPPLLVAGFGVGAGDDVVIGEGACEGDGPLTGEDDAEGASRGGILL